MFAHERHQAISHLLSQQLRLTVLELQSHLGISPATLRRDLSEMEQAGQIVRVHGGVLHPRALQGESSLDRKSKEATACKRAMAAEAALHIPDGASVFVDSGTTCLALAGFLMARPKVKIITNSVPVLQMACEKDRSVIGLGGELRPISGALTGGQPLAALGKLRADFAVIGASALSLGEGLFTTELSEAAIKQEFIRRASHCLLLADARKWKQSAMVRFGGWSEVHTFITNDLFSEQEADVLAALGPKVLRCRPL